jgi:polyphenol oxidase
MQIIRSNILSEAAEIIHGISTRIAGEGLFHNNLSKHVGDDIVAVMKNRERFYAALGINGGGFAHANQVHSATPVIITEPGLYKECDALITTEPDLFLVISVADCLPVMIYDRRTGAIANIHSGWRGTQKGIVICTIEKMKLELGSRAEDMIVFVGPGISADKFEVGRDVAELFDEKYILRPPLNPLLANEGTLKTCVDLKSIVLDQLLSCGVINTGIEVSPYCTFSSGEMHSYRRDKEKSGRMFAVIGKAKRET